MATPTISVNKETVRQLLEGSSKQPFLIPEYQRPYAWSDDEITTLFDDLREFAENEVTKNNDSTEGTYFLGTVVSYINEDKEQEIIDGQQRITSILLLLRAIYTKLKSASVKTDEAKNFIKQIGPSIWRQNKLTGAVDYSKILISSRVMDDIRPYSNDGPNEVKNGILLRSDIHKLFDDGYITITPNLEVLVSNRLHSDFGNGKMYYQYNREKLISTPADLGDLPSKEYLEWHNDTVFLR